MSYVEGVYEEVTWSAPIVIDMLKGTEEMDIPFFLSALTTIGHAQKCDTSEVKGYLNEINDLVQGQGKKILDEALEHVSFEDLFLNSEHDNLDKISKFHDLVEFSGLYQFMNKKMQENLFFILKGNLAMIRSYPDKFECLYMHAARNGDVLLVNNEHIIRTFLRDVMRATRNAWLGIV